MSNIEPGDNDYLEEFYQSLLLNASQYSTNCNENLVMSFYIIYRKRNLLVPRLRKKTLIMNSSSKQFLDVFLQKNKKIEVATQLAKNYFHLPLQIILPTTKSKLPY